MKNFKGKAIYCPKGKAQEYAKFACNFYVGCSNSCEYCYLKKGRGAAILGGSTPTLKKCFTGVDNAYEVFEKELLQNLAELQKHGIFFSFSTDPMLPETIYLTAAALDLAVSNGVPVKILTKMADWADPDSLVNELEGFPYYIAEENRRMIAFGFSLTGHDEIEPGASNNSVRIEAMRMLHKAGFKTWASIEPIIDTDSSWRMISGIFSFCDLLKIGLESGKTYDQADLVLFIEGVNALCSETKIYYKKSMLKQAGISREDLPENCVGSDYNIFRN